MKERQGFPKYLVIQEWSLTHTAEYGRGTPLNKANRDESLETSIIPGTDPDTPRPDSTLFLKFENRKDTILIAN